MAARPDELTRFVREALQRQTPRPEIERVLLEAGWSPEQVRKALAAFVDVPFPVPVPRPVVHVSAGEAFLHLVLFTALGMTALSVVELVFALIDYLFYDPAALGSVEGIRSDVRWAVASAFIAFPVFLVASWLVERSLRDDPAGRESAVRRWLTYLAMFVAVLVLLGDFVTLVAYLLSGGTTARFMLKVLFVALVAGLILGYYLWDVRRTQRASRRVARSFLAVAVLIWMVAVVSGLWLMGSPAEQAERRVDEKRLQDLQSLAQGVDRYYQTRSELPPSLDTMSFELAMTYPMRDPETGTPYRYSRAEGKNFELCAVFAFPSADLPPDSVWNHGAGDQCFTLRAGQDPPR